MHVEPNTFVFIEVVFEKFKANSLEKTAFLESDIHFVIFSLQHHLASVLLPQQ